MLSTTYDYVNGTLTRIIEVLWGGFFMEDGGYMPQHVVDTFVSPVLADDPDHADAVEWVNVIAAEEYAAQFE